MLCSFFKQTASYSIVAFTEFKNIINMKALLFIVSYVKSKLYTYKCLLYATTLCLQSEKQFPAYGIGTELSLHAILNKFIL
jgi:hypothetical protein